MPTFDQLISPNGGQFYGHCCKCGCECTSLHWAIITATYVICPDCVDELESGE